MSIARMYRNFGANDQAVQSIIPEGFPVVDANAVAVYNPLAAWISGDTVQNANTANSGTILNLNGAAISADPISPIRTKTITTNGTSSFLSFTSEPYGDAGPETTEVIFKVPSPFNSAFQLFSRGWDGYGAGWSRQVIICPDSIDAPFVVGGVYYPNIGYYSMVAGAWYYFAESWSPDAGVRDYVNGRRLFTNAALPNANLRSSTIGLRFLRFMSTHYAGVIGAIRISNVVRTESFIADQARVLGVLTRL